MQPGYQEDLSRMKNVIENGRDKIEEVRVDDPEAQKEKLNLNLGEIFLKARHGSICL